MHETFRMLGTLHEDDLARDARKQQLAAESRSTHARTHHSPRKAPRTAWVVLRYLAVTLTLTCVAIVAIAFPAGSQQPGQRTTITLFDASRTNYERVIDTGRRGFSPGDIILLRDAQFDPQTCERVGTVTGRLTINKLAGDEDSWFLGDFTVHLADGKLTAYGAAKFSEFNQDERGVFAVTGGTDTYRDASGEVKFQEGVAMCGGRGALTTIDLGPQP